jgi:hypothetical protein
MNQKYCLVITLLFTFACKAGDDYVTIAILAKDKAHTLPLYLQCLETQTWPKEKTYLYIRTNNNNDETVEILQNWIEKVSDQYAEIYFDDSDVDVPVQQYKQHEWTYDRFKVLGEIRQDSVDWAYAHNSHYFVADCDNFIVSDTIESLMKTNLPIIAPFLRCSDYDKRFYSNYHETIDVNGYYLASVFYYDILDQKVRGIIEVPVVHCTYFIRYDVLDKIYYDDESWRYEYVIFSDSARKQNIPQYIDNRKIYGYISFAESTQEFQKEEFLNKF